MSREINTTHQIALLATGDEICQGDIANSNSQEIAHKLRLANMEVRLHVSAPDTIREIKNSMNFLLEEHQALVITGGLGPTSDDLTRFALSEVIGKPLIFDEPTWQALCLRLQKLGYPIPPESNRQQALFPAGATIIPNPNGTAAGCMVEFSGKWIFLLPGPPNECLPMIDEVVIPTLTRANFSRTQFHRSWYLFSVSEGKIAEELDALLKPYDCITGYRLFYPYLEFKILSPHEAEFQKALPLVEKVIAPYLIGDGQHIASYLLREKLKMQSTVLTICDRATGGALEAALKTPATHKKLNFLPDASSLPRIEINGLLDYWLGTQDIYTTDLETQLINEKHHEKFTQEIPFRGKRVIHYAVELVCKQIYEWLQH